MKWPFSRARREKANFRKEQWGVVAIYAKEEAPPMLAVANKAGSNGAVPGYIVPLDKTPQEIDLMHARLDGGDYGVVTPDRKAALSLRVAPLRSLEWALEEILEHGPSADSRVGSRLARLLEQDPLLASIRISEPGDQPEAIRDMLYRVGDRIAVQGAGIFRDVEVNLWWEPGEWTRLAKEAEDHPALRFCAVSFVPDEQAPGTWGTTVGLYRFGKQELAVLLEREESERVAVEFLFGLASYVMLGSTILPGHTVGGDERPLLRAHPATSLPQALRGTDVLELRPCSAHEGAPPYADQALVEIMER